MRKLEIPFISTEYQNDVYVIAVEGCNGTGKTTLCNEYSIRHPEIEYSLCVPDIYQTEKNMKHYMLFQSSALCSALYYLAGAIEIRKLHNPSINKVLFDRSLWSTFAAAYVKDESIMSDLFNCLKSLRNYLLFPNKVIVLEASYETAIFRISNKSTGAEFDKDKLDEYNKKAFFYHLLKDAGYNVSFIDTENKTETEVYNEFVALCNNFKVEK